MKITYFIDDKLGGVSSLNYNLMANTGHSEAEQEVIHLDLLESEMTRSSIRFPANRFTKFTFSNTDNYYHTLRRLSKLVNRRQEGALVLNYDTEMAMLDHYPAQQTTYQLVHDDYNVKLAIKYSHVVDVFICHNTEIFHTLNTLFPDRADSIFYCPHGVTIPTFSRKAAAGPIRLLFLGRMSEGKGIFDLPVINDMLRSQSIKFEWTCIGNGPRLAELKEKWNVADTVKFISPDSSEEVLKLCAACDVFVLPTKFEGSPVSLLETMSVGLVPVVSKIKGGITDIVTEYIGFTPDIDDNMNFVKAIKKLADDRTLLERLSLNCRKKIEDELDIRVTAANYHQLFQRYRDFYKPKKLRFMKEGARLDQIFIPNFLTKFIRTNFAIHGK